MDWPLWCAALAAALLLSALCTPAHWWRRPTLANIGLVAFLATSAVLLWQRQAPAAGEVLRVQQALNLRAAPSTASTRLTVLPAGTIVTLTGQRQGDWREVRAGVHTGWSNSLWLRRRDEAQARGKDG